MEVRIGDVGGNHGECWQCVGSGGDSDRHTGVAAVATVFPLLYSHSHSCSLSHSTMYAFLPRGVLLRIASIGVQKIEVDIRAHHAGPPSPAVELLRLSAPHRDPISGNSSELVTIVRSFKLGQSWAQDAPKVGLRAATVCLNGARVA